MVKSESLEERGDEQATEEKNEKISEYEKQEEEKRKKEEELCSKNEEYSKKVTQLLTYAKNQLSYDLKITKQKLKEMVGYMNTTHPPILKTRDFEDVVTLAWKSTHWERVVNKKLSKIAQDEMIKKAGGFEQFLHKPLEMADAILKVQPIYYNKFQDWMVWNTKTYQFEKKDEVDILNKVYEITGIDTLTINSKQKNELLLALKQRGRLSEPKEPPHSWVQFKDTIVDIKTGEEFPATPEYLFYCPIPWSLGESEDTPIIDSLFSQWLPTPDGLRQLQEIPAYAMLLEQFLQRMIALEGDGSNGKGTYIKIIVKFIGENNCFEGDMKKLSSNGFASSGIYRKNLCTIGEVSENDIKDTKMIKQLCGEDKIQYEFKRQTPFSEMSFCTFIIATNSLPISPDLSDGYMRRWHILPFKQKFPIKHGVFESIPDVEYENFARKSVRIARELYASCSFTGEGTISERRAKYESRSNPITSFIKEYCIEEGKMNFSDFFVAYNKYLVEHNLREVSRVALSKRLKDEQFVVKDGRLYDDELPLLINLQDINKKLVDFTGEEEAKPKYPPSRTCIFGLTLTFEAIEKYGEK